MAKQQSQQSQTELTPRGAELAEREATMKKLGLQQNYGKHDKLVHSVVRESNLRLRTTSRRIKPDTPLPFRHLRIVPSFMTYYEEQPSTDGLEQLKIHRSKQEARGARFTIRHPGLGGAPGEKFHFRLPLDGSAVSWAGPHIDEFGAEGEEMLIRAILADPNWCPRQGNSAYYVVILSDDDLEALGQLEIDEDAEIAEARRVASVESARQGLGVAVAGTREQTSGTDPVRRVEMSGGYKE